MNKRQASRSSPDTGFHFRKEIMSGEVIRYSKAFKRQVVEEFAQGKLKTPQEIRLAYGIRGTSTTTYWLKNMDEATCRLNR